MGNTNSQEWLELSEVYLNKCISIVASLYTDVSAPLPTRKSLLVLVEFVFATVCVELHLECLLPLRGLRGLSSKGILYKDKCGAFHHNDYIHI